MRLQRVFSLTTFTALALLVWTACSGGSTTQTPAVTTVNQTLVAGSAAENATLSDPSGYVVNLSLPATSDGSSGSLALGISTTLPTGVAAPSSKLRTPQTIGTTLTPLVYVTVRPSTNVTFASTPSFSFTLPGGTSLTTGSSAYVGFYDPAQTATGWVTILGPGSVSGKSIAFTASAGTVKLVAGSLYTFALFASPQAPVITSTTVPAYCSGFTALSGVPLNLTDDSGLGAALIVYVTNGVNFMDQNGNFTQANAYPLPAACFSTTVGSGVTNKPLAIPTGVSGRIYLAYATPNPSPSTVPNPMTGINSSGPNAGFAAHPFPWDKIEYGTVAGGVIDTTQVDALGLPMELSVTGGALPQSRNRVADARRQVTAPAPCATPAPTAGIVGVTSCNYAAIFQAMSAIPQYSQLVVTQSFNGNLLDMQVVAPKDSVTFTSFQWNLFGLAADLPAPAPTFCPTSGANGYLGCVLAAYNTPLAQGRLFQTSGIGASNVSGHNYCATSDGTSNFQFTDVGTATSCASATPNPSPAMAVNPINMPVQEFTYGVAPIPPGQGCTQAILFSQPFGNAQVGSGQIFAAPDAFALWKDVSADLNRGVMLSTAQAHPVGLVAPALSLFFKDPMYNAYAQVVHTYFDNNLAYALAYDDLGNFESGVTWAQGDSFNVRVNAIPSASSASTVPVPVPLPSPCSALPTGVGTF